MRDDYSNEIEVVRYEVHHSYYLRRWAKERELDLDMDLMPQLGFVALFRSHPTAAGFIRMCESALAIIDSFITDPFANPDVRYQVMDHLLDRTLKECKLKGFKKVMALSQDKNTIYRAERHGFRMRPYTVLTLKGAGED